MPEGSYGALIALLDAMHYDTALFCVLLERYQYLGNPKRTGKYLPHVPTLTYWGQSGPRIVTT